MGRIPADAPPAGQDASWLFTGSVERIGDKSKVCARACSFSELLWPFFAHARSVRACSATRLSPARCGWRAPAVLMQHNSRLAFKHLLCTTDHAQVEVRDLWSEDDVAVLILSRHIGAWLGALQCGSTC